MKLSEWAKTNGIQYRTAWRMFKLGHLPVKAFQVDTGTIYIDMNYYKQDKCATIYARVSSHDQKNDLDRQVARLIEYATVNNIAVTAVVKEIGSGVNGHRKKIACDTR